jgi:uncharacterized membrane protein
MTDPSGTVAPAPKARLARRWPLLATTLLATVVESFPAPPAALAVAGLWVLFGAPFILWYALADAVVSTRDGRAILAVGGAVLGDIVIALLVNTTLPWAGVESPLQRIPLVAAFVAAILVLTAVAPAPRPARRGVRMVPGLAPVLWLGALCVTLSIAGPTRLNNGLPGTVAVIALLAVAALMSWLFLRRRRHTAMITGLGIFFVALSLLFLTSLRSWYLTGHDIQREYSVYHLTDESGRWQVPGSHDAYDSCLSITLLPVAIARLTGIPGTYVFKVIIPILFAVAPAALYRTARHGAPQAVAILAAFYFVAFPTFFTDMPFLARQEIAFLLLACILVLFADGARPLRTRQVVVTVLLVGIVLSHYSTTYVLLGVLGIAYLTGLGWRLAARRRGDFGPRFARPVMISWWMIVVTAVAAFLWTGPATHSGQQAHTTATNAMRELLGKKSASGSSDTGYSIVGGTRTTASQRLVDYAAETTRATSARRAAGAYPPLGVVDRYPVVAAELPLMPLTRLGCLLDRAGVDVVGLNALIRLSVARLLQLLLLVGLVLAVFARRPVFRATSDQLILSAGALGLIAVLTVLPDLSVDYGVLRAFQQGLFFFAPFIAAASIAIFRWAGRRSTVLAFGLASGLFLDLTGVVPKLVGGYSPQLHLANAGQYYDIYYAHPEERSGVTWLLEKDREDGFGIQTDRYTFGRMESRLNDEYVDDIFPSLIARGTYVLLGFTTVRRDEATVFYRGDLVTYRYPTGLLDYSKNKIYSSEGAEVYR